MPDRTRNIAWSQMEPFSSKKGKLPIKNRPSMPENHKKRNEFTWLMVKDECESD